MPRKRYTQVPEDFATLPLEEQQEIAMDLAHHIAAQLSDRVPGDDDEDDGDDGLYPEYNYDYEDDE